MNSKYKPSFISFAEARIQSQGEEIRAWAKSNNPLLAQICEEIIDAAQAGAP